MANVATAGEIDGLDELTATPYAAGEGLPLFLSPRETRLADDPEAFIAWFKARWPDLEALVGREGAIVLRGFAARTTQHFAALVSDFPGLDTGYAGGATPRAALAEKVFESTRLPAEHKLPLHQEMAYLPSYPSKLAFFCHVAAETGGETILGDMRRFGRMVDRRFWDAVRARGVCYHRNYRSPGWTSGHPMLDSYHRPWTEAMDVATPEAAEEKAHAMGFECRWEANDSLSLSFRNAGFVTHPQTGELLWFNQIAPQSFIPESIGAERFGLYEQYYGPDIPRPVFTTFGDGGRMDRADIAALHPQLDAVTVGFPWRAGDVMILDNFNVAHGRNPFTGKRDVQVTLIA